MKTPILVTFIVSIMTGFLVSATFAQPYYYYHGERMDLNVLPDQFVALSSERETGIDSKLVDLNARMLHKSEISGRELRLFNKSVTSLFDLQSTHPDVLFSPLLTTQSGGKAFGGAQIIARLKNGVALDELRRLNAQYNLRIVHNEHSK